MIPGQNRQLACLYAHGDKLSGQCEKALYEWVSVLDRAISTIAYLADQCRADIESKCAYVQPGQGRIAQCLADARGQPEPALHPGDHRNPRADRVGRSDRSGAWRIQIAETPLAETQAPPTGGDGTASAAPRLRRALQSSEVRSGKIRAVTDVCRETCPISLSTETSCPDQSLTRTRRNIQAGFAQTLDHVLRHLLREIAELNLVPGVRLEIRIQLRIAGPQPAPALLCPSWP